MTNQKYVLNTNILTHVKNVPSFYINTDGVKERNFFLSYSRHFEEEYNNDTDDVIFDDEYWLIDKVEVKKEYRGRGIAREIITEAIEEMIAECPALDIKLICQAADADTNQDKLTAFYESMGFEFDDDPLGRSDLMTLDKNRYSPRGGDIKQMFIKEEKSIYYEHDEVDFNQKVYTVEYVIDTSIKDKCVFCYEVNEYTLLELCREYRVETTTPDGVGAVYCADGKKLIQWFLDGVYKVIKKYKTEEQAEHAARIEWLNELMDIKKYSNNEKLKDWFYTKEEAKEEANRLNLILKQDQEDTDNE